MCKDMFGIEIALGHYVAYIGASEYANKAKGYVTEVDGRFIQIDGKGKMKAAYNCVSLETEGVYERSFRTRDK